MLNHIFLQVERKIVFLIQKKLKKYLNKIKIHRWDYALMVPRMTYKEYTFFKNYLNDNREAVYLESGSGGSTLIAENTMQTAISYETAPSYVAYMNGLLKRMQVTALPIGEVIKFGYPLNPTKEKAKRVSEALCKHFPLQKNDKAIVFLDGRCRVHNGLKLLPLLSAKDRVLVHDFERKEYQDLLLFYDIEKRIDRLVVLKVKSDYAPEILQDYGLKYANDFR